ncbi:TetR/AcrR family transcriptional regulator [Knoellia locipacati]|uniref:TetR/AcrR family transcriptional regulator n=1 Tax=Knoellia locipacati TaxID=882824 RepID=UPI00384E46B7
MPRTAPAAPVATRSTAPATAPAAAPATASATASGTARQRVLDAAFGLFYARGIRAVGVDLIIAESGVAKATFYKYFPAKDDLVVAYLDVVDEVWSRQLHEAAEAAGPAPADQMVGLFDALAHACRREGYRGCGFINAAAESTPGSRVHDRTVAHKTAVRDWVRGLAAAAGADDPDELARGLTLLLDGGLASGALDASPEVPEIAKTSARALVDLAVGRTAQRS